MKMSLLLPPKFDDHKWILAKQVGVHHVITKAAPELSGKSAPYNYEALKSVRDDFGEAGFNLYGLEGDQFDMSPIKLGMDSRDEWIEKYQQLLRNMGKLEIPLLCLNFMASVGWYRTRIDVQERGDALTSEFNYKDIEGKKVPPELQISEKKVWENLFYFLDAVLPVAEETGVQMALHPDDPPVSPFMGVGRILTSASAFDKILTRYDSPSLGITFCQATFKTMGENIVSISKKWLKQNKIFFIHLRDVEGDKYHFRETFHDNGPTDMAAMLKHYHEHGFDGPIRPDHAPAMHGERHSDFSGSLSAGYEMIGKVFAIGYMKGICDSFKK